MILRDDPALPVGRSLEYTFRQRVKSGWYLEWNGFEVFMTEKEAGPVAAVGQTIQAFSYRDSEGRLTAVAQPGKLLMGQIGFLTVNHMTPLGAFLDWGLPKELLLAKPEMKRQPEPGDRVLVRLLLDEDNRPAATARVWETLEEPPQDWRRGKEVLFCVLSKGHYGLAVALDNSYRGFLPLPNAPFSFGETGRGWYLGRDNVGRGRLSLRPQGGEGLRETAENLIKKLEANGGFLPVHDRSPPETILARTGMSKQDFKKVVGILYRERRIEILGRGIRLSETAVNEASPTAP